MTIEQLEAKVIRLRAECFAFAVGACGGHYGDDYCHSRCSLVDAQRTRAEAAEALAAEVIRLRQENDRLSQRVENLREALGDMLDDCEPDRPGAPRLSIREAARAAFKGGDYEA